MSQILPSKEEKELVIWHEFDGPGDTSIEVLEHICRLYTERCGLKVTAEVMDIEQLGKRIGRVSQTGEAPHIAFVPSDMTSYIEGGLYSSLPEELSSRLDVSESSFATMRVDGVSYGVPVLLGNHLVLYYNEELYKTAPASWEEIAEQADRLKQAGIVPVGADLKQAYGLVPFMSAFGGWPMKDGKPAIDSDELENALHFISGQQKEGLLASYDGPTELLELFIAGKIGAIITGEWIYNHLSRNMPERLAVAAIPAIAGREAVSMSSSIGLVFPGHSLEGDYREDILSFVTFMLSRECQLLWAAKVQRIPANENVLAQLQEEASANRRALISQLKLGRPIPTHPHMIAVWVGMEEALAALEDGTPSQARVRMAHKVEEVIVEIDNHIKRLKGGEHDDRYDFQPNFD